jgi:hypothetical protein
MSITLKKCVGTDIIAGGDPSMGWRISHSVGFGVSIFTLSMALDGDLLVSILAASADPRSRRDGKNNGPVATYAARPLRSLTTSLTNCSNLAQ